jgi:uncharacterized damage-inducible protein DinB
MQRDQILRLYAYHHWAADRAFAAVSSLTATQLDQHWGGSFGTGRALLRHVAGVERLWLERWRGNSLKALPDFPPTHSGRDFQREWVTVKSDQVRYLDELTTELVAGELTYVNLKGERWTYPFADLLTHVVNHGTYHRGQITHLLRDLGLAAPATDYLLFVEDRRKG